MKNNINWIILGILFWITAVSCTPETPPTPAPIEPVTTARVTATTGIESTMTVETVGTAVPTRTPIPTLTPAATDTPTAMPTLSPGEALAAVTTLYETNGSCLLPCWWGFTPGSSLWVDAKAVLLPLSNDIYEGEDDSADQVKYGIVKLPNTYYSGLDAGRSIPHTYLVKSGIIQAINVFASEPTALFTPVSILNTYGMPEEIYLGTWQGGTGYWMTFFYPQYGFRISYHVLGGSNENDVISACFQEGFPYLTVWPPDSELSFIETYALFNEEADSDYQIPLDMAAGMDVPTFYEMFSNPDVPICLETPTDIWPGY